MPLEPGSVRSARIHRTGIGELQRLRHAMQAHLRRPRQELANTFLVATEVRRGVVGLKRRLVAPLLKDDVMAGIPDDLREGVGGTPGLRSCALLRLAQQLDELIRAAD